MMFKNTPFSVFNNAIEISTNIIYPDSSIKFKTNQLGSNKPGYWNEGLLKWTISLHNETHPMSASTRSINIRLACIFP